MQPAIKPSSQAQDETACKQTGSLPSLDALSDIQPQPASTLAYFDLKIPVWLGRRYPLLRRMLA